ncbi:Replicative DNA helicase [Phycisphaerales bacterium]|nr:Replicative DNA helicase [Phycisphaerales bacterium]
MQGRDPDSRDRRRIAPISAKELFDRQPPAAVEAEMSLLGSMILDPNIIPDVLGIIRNEGDFWKEAHSHIYRAVIDVYDQRHSGDLVQIIDILRDRGVIDQIGGPNYLVELASAVPSATNAPHFARIVCEKAKLRRLIDAAGQILYDAYHAGELGPEGAREVLDSAEMRVFEIAQEQNAADPQALAELLDLELKRIEAADFDGGGLSGVPSGYPDLDELLRGFQPGEMLVLAARPSMGKCLAFDSEIVLDDGSVVTIEELYRRREGVIPTLDNRLKLRRGSPSDFIDDGRKPVFEVTTRLGRRIRTTLTHPFLTVQGWSPLDNLKVGDFVAVPRRMDVFGDRPMRDCEVKLLGYLIGDGGLTGATPRFTNSNQRIAADFAHAVEQFGGLSLALSSRRDREAPSWNITAHQAGVRSARQSFAASFSQAMSASGLTQRSIAAQIGVTPASITHWKQGLTTPDQKTFDRLCIVLRVTAADLAADGISVARTNAPNALSRWLSDLGLMGHGAGSKHVPAGVFTLPREQIALFLNRLFATDGWATVLASGQSQFGYSTICERLARQVQHLLLRFGVIASLRLRWVKYKDARRPSWQLDITDAASIRTFIEEIGIFGKEEQLARVSEELSKNYQTNKDLIPLEVWNAIEAAMGGRSWRWLAQAIGAPGDNVHVGTRRPTRARLAKIAEALDSDPLRDLAASDVYWDRIVSIEPLGRQQVYDLTMPGTHNFVANDVCVHNTALALNLAEQIAIGGVPVPGAPPSRRSPVGLFSLEMSKNAIVQRLLSARSGVSSQALRGGHKIPDDDFRRLMMAAEDLKAAPVYIDDTPNLSVLNLRARARRMVAQHGVKVLMVDYLQLMSAPHAARESRQVEVSAISRGVKALARELNVPVICLSQLNRASEQREGNRPRMADLRESGSIEQDADVIMLLHREEYYHIQDEDWKAENPDKIGMAEVIIAKQRNGPTGVVKFSWDSNATRFRSHDATARAPVDFTRDFSGYSSPSQAAAKFPVQPTRPQPGKPWTHSEVKEAPPFNFAPGNKTGPIEHHRDGGGPERETPGEGDEPQE